MADELGVTLQSGTRIPDEYYMLSDAQLDERIRAAKAKLGDQVVLLGHHYQGARVIQWADFTGDSFKLAQLALTRSTAKYIVFCGVHFMAETADVLSPEETVVILPDLGAGCSMADMANERQVDDCWSQLAEKLPGSKIIPITYMNSTAALKAFCGENDGAVCTSSNAEGILKWAFERGEKVLFFPDQHLGRNTGYKMGIPLEQMVIYNPLFGDFECTDEELQNAKIILWKGFCSVHQKFTTEQEEEVRRLYPDMKIIVHPECSLEVVLGADYVGSTEYIIKVIEQSPAGSQWAIGTEINLVHRLAEDHKDKLIVSLSGPNVCPCATMYRISPQHLCWALEQLAAGHVVNHVQVDPETRKWAGVALERMLAIAK
ncbi:MAG TPA: quinolinate synthase NadA [Symbiobacteriaceae bacterium]|nr:quinolinate synthase NadA [Symbiobacteriaceae bacterium]